MFDVPITVQDRGGKLDFAYLHVNVTDVNDNPPFFLATKYMVNVHADAEVGTSVVRVSPTLQICNHICTHSVVNMYVNILHFFSL